MPRGKKKDDAPANPPTREEQRRAKQQAQFDAAKRRSQEAFERNADNFIASHPHGAPHYTPNPYPGVTCENRADANGRYQYIRRPGGQIGSAGG